MILSGNDLIEIQNFFFKIEGLILGIAWEALAWLCRKKEKIFRFYI